MRSERDRVEYVRSRGRDQIKAFTAAIETEAEIVFRQHQVGARSEAAAGRKNVFGPIGKIVREPHASEVHWAGAFIIKLDEIGKFSVEVHRGNVACKHFV